jgi:fatty acid desaturase
VHQIEHHLFPKVPRNKLEEAQTIVKAFCHAHSLPYYEARLLQSYRELLQAPSSGKHPTAQRDTSEVTQ